jgi:hypothetical protein
MQVRQVRGKSKDGTEVPITLIHRPDVALDGSNRTLLYGYGGYGISQWPFYSSFVAAWLRLGGVYAVATIRGGSEFGSAWHEGGRLSKQQNSFDDFAAAAEWLIANGVTRRERLGIFGASNGGRLVLTTMLQRPDLIGAVVSGVPVADMVRFPKFTFGVSWTPEYGDPSKPGLSIVINKFRPNRFGGPHYHPNDRFITVIEGAAWTGTGPVVDPAHAMRIPKGTFRIDHANKVHWDGTKEETGAYLITGIGPATNIETPKVAGPYTGGDPSAATIILPDQIAWKDNGNNRVEKFSSTGTYLTQWGSTGAGNGQFSSPSSIGVDAAGTGASIASSPEALRSINPSTCSR